LLVTIVCVFWATIWLGIPPTKIFFLGVAFIFTLAVVVVSTVVSLFTRSRTKDNGGKNGNE
jgi:hypothetical protein